MGMPQKLAKGFFSPEGLERRFIGKMDKMWRDFYGHACTCNIVGELLVMTDLTLSRFGSVV